MRTIDKLIEQLKYKRRATGDIIDDRSLNRIPLTAYAEEYKEIDRILKILEAERENRLVVLPCYGKLG